MRVFTYIIFLSFFAVLFMPNTQFVFAQTSGGSDWGNFEVGIPGGAEQGSAITSGGGFKGFIGALATFITGLIIVIGVIVIIIAGYIYMTARGDASQVQKAKTMILSALAGIVLAVAAVVILETINTQLGTAAEEPTLSIPPASGSGS